MATLTLLLLAALICQGAASFDCRRPEQSCLNSGTCLYTSTDCGTCGANEGYNCGLVTVQIVSGACGVTCQNGGTCYNTGTGSDKCYCPSTHYGDLCELLRLNVFCEIDKMTIGVNPESTFATGLAYIEDKREIVGCRAVAVPAAGGSDSVPDEWLGLAFTLLNNDVDCGVITVEAEGANSVFKRTVVVQFNELLVTSSEDRVEVKCVFDPNDVLLESSVTKIADGDLSGLTLSTVTGKFTPATLLVESGGAPVVAGTPLVIGAGVKFTFSVPAEYGAVLVMEGTARNADVGNPQSLKLVTAGCMDDAALSITMSPPAQVGDAKTVAMEIYIFQFYGVVDVDFEFTVRVCLITDTTPCDAVTTCNGGVNQFGRRKRETDTFEESEIGTSITVMDPAQLKEYEQRKAASECSTSKEITAAMIIMGIVILTLLTLTLILIAKLAMSRKSRAQSKQDLYSAGSVQSMPQI